MALTGMGEAMRIERWALIAAAAQAAVAMGLGSAQAQPASPPAASPAPAALDPAFEAARKAFEALGEPDRRALQEALIWTGDYKGGFGRGTRDAINAYAKRANLPTDGTLDQKARAALTAAGAKARDGTAFKVVNDAKSGVAIGLPTKILTKKTDLPNGARFASNDGAATLDVFQAPDTGSDLTSLYDRLRTDAPNRKVTYKIARPDFFVVSGEAAGKNFYTRVARGTGANGSGVLRGYTLSYPASAKASFDIYSIAVASSFSPFATAAIATTSAAPPRPAGPGSTSPTAPPVARPVLAGTAVAVAPGKALAVLPGACANPSIGGRPAKAGANDAHTGLILFEVPGQTAPALSLNVAAKAGPVVALQHAARASAAPTPPQQQPATDLTVAPGEWLATARVLAPLQAGGAGAAIFDRSGAFIGVAGRLSATPRLVAGVVPQSSNATISGSQIAAFLEPAGVKLSASSATGDKTAGEIAAAARASILPVVCTQ